MRELEPCPKCKSGDVGGASGIVHCYKCGEEQRANTTPAAADAWNIRAILLRNGYTVKEGEHDLERYVYLAAHALLQADRERRANDGENAMQEACRDLPPDYLMQVCIERGAGWIDLADEHGNKIEFDEDTDSGMTGRIRNATACATDHWQGLL